MPKYSISVGINLKNELEKLSIKMDGKTIVIAKNPDGSYLETTLNSDGALAQTFPLMMGDGEKIKIKNPRTIDAHIAVNLIESFKDQGSKFTVNDKSVNKDELEKVYTNLRVKYLKLDSLDKINEDLKVDGSKSLNILKSYSENYSKKITELTKDNNINPEDYIELEKMLKNAQEQKVLAGLFAKYKEKGQKLDFDYDKKNDRDFFNIHKDLKESIDTHRATDFMGFTVYDRSVENDKTINLDGYKLDKEFTPFEKGTRAKDGTINLAQELMDYAENNGLDLKQSDLADAANIDGNKDTITREEIASYVFAKAIASNSTPPHVSHSNIVTTDYDNFLSENDIINKSKNGKFDIDPEFIAELSKKIFIDNFKDNVSDEEKIKSAKALNESAKVPNKTKISKEFDGYRK